MADTSDELENAIVSTVNSFLDDQSKLSSILQLELLSPAETASE
jgi:hypothetical protein